MREAGSEARRRELDLVEGAEQDEEAERGDKSRAAVEAWCSLCWATRVETGDDEWREAELAAAEFAAEVENGEKEKAAAKKARLRDHQRWGGGGAS